MERRRSHVDVSVDGFENSRRLAFETLTSSGPEHLEQEKRVRREIANSNERRRMQSINAGFDTLRMLLPPIQDGEKMSKATILQLTAEYINSLLNRINVLENEVTVYRQAAGVQPSTVIQDYSFDLGLSRKRKSEEQKKRPGSTRPRRRRVDPDHVQRSDIAACSPLDTDARQASPSNSFNSSISISPPSPLVDFTNTTSARLEHLVMAIEQIEGGRALQTLENESQDDSVSTGGRSPPITNEAYWQSPQSCSFPDAQNSSLKPITSFSDPPVTISSSHTPNLIISTSESDAQSRSTTDYPLVTKLLNHPIPHKYLHRPQVVANSSH